jgi:hypothetical protein
MASRVDIDVSPQQAHAIKQVGNVRHQAFRRKRSRAARDRRDKEKKKGTGEEKLTGSDKGRVRYDGTKGGIGSEEQREDSRNKSKKEKDSKVPGSLVDVVV